MTCWSECEQQKREQRERLRAFMRANLRKANEADDLDRARYFAEGLEDNEHRWAIDDAEVALRRALHYHDRDSAEVRQARRDLGNARDAKERTRLARSLAEARARAQRLNGHLSPQEQARRVGERAADARNCAAKGRLA